MYEPLFPAGLIFRKVRRVGNMFDCVTLSEGMPL
jgi:hypothetical protein